MSFSDVVYIRITNCDRGFACHIEIRLSSAILICHALCVTDYLCCWQINPNL